MQFTGVLSFAAALFVAGAVAQPHAGGPPSITQSKTQCPGGKVTCCVNKSDVQGDGILDNLLSRGLLTDVLGASDQACAHTDLIGELNLLGFTKGQDENTSCSGATYCCPNSGGVSISDIFQYKASQLTLYLSSLATLSKKLLLGPKALSLAY